MCGWVSVVGWALLAITRWRLEVWLGVKTRLAGWLAI